VVFFLRTQDDVAEDAVAPAGTVMGYSEIARATTNYTDILKSIETASVGMNSELLKSILDKAVYDEYPQDTACFWCCHAFQWTPAVLPISYDAYKNTYTCEGHFCSPECGLAFLYTNVRISDTTRWNRHTLLRHMYASLYEARDLSPALPRASLRMFGGALDIAQYRSYTSGVNEIVHAELPPIRLIFPTMNIQGPIRDIKKYVSLSTDVVEKASRELRLKRAKPIHAHIQTLDMCLR
jgi:hypothetical protein